VRTARGESFEHVLRGGGAVGGRREAEAGYAPKCPTRFGKLRIDPMLASCLLGF
jgi:hypothetical protein